MISWSDKYSVRIKKIDEQHQMFIDLINQLEVLIDNNDFLEGLPRLLNEIVEYAGYHFKTEEEYLEKVSYQQLEKHKMSHINIKRDIYVECKKVIEKEPTALDVMWLFNYLRDWIKNHILEEDLAYVEALKEFHDM